MLTKEKAKDLLRSHVHTDWLIKHSLASAEIMAALAERFQENSQYWWSIGLIHDLDFDITQDPSLHGLKSKEILEREGIDPEVIQTVMAHNAEGLGIQRRSRLDFALTAAESITGLVVATALVMPDKKLASVKPSSIIKRMKKKDFARRVSRESIQMCEQIGLSLEDFAEIALKALQGVAEELGL